MTVTDFTFPLSAFLPRHFFLLDILCITLPLALDPSTRMYFSYASSSVIPWSLRPDLSNSIDQRPFDVFSLFLTPDFYSFHSSLSFLSLQGPFLPTSLFLLHNMLSFLHLKVVRSQATLSGSSHRFKITVFRSSSYNSRLPYTFVLNPFFCSRLVRHLFLSFLDCFGT